MKDLHHQSAVPLSRHLSHDTSPTEHALLVEMNDEIACLRKENRVLLKEHERVTTLYDEMQLQNNRLISVQEDLCKQLEEGDEERNRTIKQM